MLVESNNDETLASAEHTGMKEEQAQGHEDTRREMGWDISEICYALYWSCLPISLLLRLHTKIIATSADGFSHAVSSHPSRGLGKADDSGDGTAQHSPWLGQVMPYAQEAIHNAYKTIVAALMFFSSTVIYYHISATVSSLYGISTSSVVHHHNCKRPWGSIAALTV